MTQLPLFSHIVGTGPATKSDKQIMALVGKAKVYPKCKKKIKEIKQKQSHYNWLAQ